MTLIMLTGKPVACRDLEFFGYPVLAPHAQRGGGRYEIWDVSGVFESGAIQGIIPGLAYPDPSQVPELRTVQTMDAFKRLMLEAKASGPVLFFLFDFGGSRFERPVIDLFDAHGIDYAYKASKFAMYDWQPELGWLSRNVKEGYRYVFRYRRFRGLRAPRYVFGATERHISNIAYVGLRTRQVRIHVDDYDRYLASMRRGARPGRYAVFLDQNLFGHPSVRDKHLLGDHGAYLGTLSRLFEQLKAEHGIDRVVIAAHPTTDCEALSAALPGYEASKHATADLVRDAALVIGHFSESLTFPVLFRKPLLFCSSEELRRHPMNERIERMAALLGRRVNYLSSGEPGGRPLDLGADLKAYDTVTATYLKQGGPGDKLSWEYILDVLRADYGGTPGEGRALRRTSKRGEGATVPASASMHVKGK